MSFRQIAVKVGMDAMTNQRSTATTDPPKAALNEEGAVLDALRSDDREAFAALCERYRRQLHVHCYRMLGSVDDADDLVQETFMKAWQARRSFEGRSLFRTWLYRIATNACLDAVARRPRRVMPQDVFPPVTGLVTDFPPPVDLPWLQPYPDRLLELPAAPADQPEELAVTKETMELAFIAAIQHLPPRQRAVFILRGVLGWPARETGSLLEMSVPSVNSALQRARARLRTKLPERRSEWARSTEISDEERELLRRYIEASGASDPDAFTALLRDDVRMTMPPIPIWWDGRESVAEINVWFLREGRFDLRAVPTVVNRQPAAAFYIREAGDSAFRLTALDVLRIEDGGIASIDVFDAQKVPGLGLPPILA